MYKCIALDMDGTLLNSKKEISEENFIAIRKAFEAGKTIVLNTGRGLSELKDFLPLLPEVQFVNCLSGALVHDVKNHKDIFSQELPYEIVQQLFAISNIEHCMQHCLSKETLANEANIDRMEEYQMGVYKEAFRKRAIACKNLELEHKEQKFGVHKFNMYHFDTESRERTRARLQEANLPIEVVDSEITSLEASQKGIDKGEGLRRLCAHLGITLDELIVVGDADNDLQALKVAGLAVAMGNANDNVKQVSHVTVSDNDHDGVAQAIYDYLLKE
ncbi:MAG: Cof-type HAD-IIB family hydrolase [Bacillota bacterium]|nr:Cof-type HAD-IIB family hydrolase [Bacillota bacterium]